MKKGKEYSTGTYNKLVRDKIPQIIEADKDDPKVAVTHIAAGEEYARMLQAKLREEVDELINAQTPDQVVEEAGDIIEVLNYYVQLAGKSMGTVESSRQGKHTTNGGFARGIVLEKVEKKQV